MTSNNVVGDEIEIAINLKARWKIVVYALKSRWMQNSKKNWFNYVSFHEVAEMIHEAGEKEVKSCSPNQLYARRLVHEQGRCKFYINIVLFSIFDSGIFGDQKGKLWVKIWVLLGGDSRVWKHIVNSKYLESDYHWVSLDRKEKKLGLTLEEQLEEKNCHYCNSLVQGKRVRSRN